MAATITQQPVDSSATVGSTHTFTIVADTVGTATYQWIVGGVAVDGVAQPFALTQSYTTLVAALDNSYTPVYCLVTDSDDNVSIQSDVVLAITTAASTFNTRHGMVYNYDDDNFTWKDPQVEIGQDGVGYALYDISYQTYGFVPGWQERWSDYAVGGVKEQTWADALGAPQASRIRWTDTFDKSDSKEVVQVTDGLVYRADQVDNRYNSLKTFFIERSQMDLDDLVPDWTTNKVKQIKQFVFHMQSDERFITTDPNTIDFYVGWSNNLMETPNYKPRRTVDLRDRDNGGKYKVDYRTSGRYLTMRYDLTDSKQLAFTGGDIDAKEAAGR
jgi:hypothetical protein